MVMVLGICFNRMVLGGLGGGRMRGGWGKGRGGDNGWMEWFDWWVKCERLYVKRIDGSRSGMVEGSVIE